MVFSRNYQQGDIIATFVKNDGTLNAVLRIYKVNGVFLVTYEIGNGLIVPFYASEQFLFISNSANTAGFTFAFKNGFRLEDIPNLANFNTAKLALNQPSQTVFSAYQPNKTTFDIYTGYTEPVVTAIDDISLMTIVKAASWGKYLNEVLKQNQISGYQSFDEFSAI